MNLNFFAGGIDRSSFLRRDAAQLAALLDRHDTRFLPVWRAQNLVHIISETAEAAYLTRAAAEPLLAAGEPPIFLGIDDGIAHFAVDISALDHGSVPVFAQAGDFADLRQIGGLLPQKQGALLAFARAITHWHRMHLFCGRCGHATRAEAGGHVRRCGSESCNAEHFPRTDPAVIMLVTHGDHCLLGRQAGWPKGMVSTLAGFVEPGETPEEAVAREVMEEAGVKVAEVRYHSCQPWPFPGSLMMGYTALAEARTDPVIDPQELEMARWYSRAELLDSADQGHSLPRKLSIARRLVDDWLAGS